MPKRPLTPGATQLRDRSVQARSLAPAGDKEMGPVFVVRVPVAAGTAAAVNVTMPYKSRVLDVWAVHTGGAGQLSDTLTVQNGANAITDAMEAGH